VKTDMRWDGGGDLGLGKEQEEEEGELNGVVEWDPEENIFEEPWASRVA
jgi:hypothetical protein